MTANVRLTLTGSMDQLRIVWQTGEALLESVPFHEDPEGTRYNILVALQEMVTNVIRHAYRGDESNPIELQFDCSEDGFSVELCDHGPPFDPLDYDLDNMPTGDRMPEQVGGYGIMIATTCMDAVAYERRDDRNCLKLTKLVDAKTMATSD